MTNGRSLLGKTGPGGPLATVLRDLRDRVARIENRPALPRGWRLANDDQGRLVAINDRKNYSVVIADPN